MPYMNLLVGLALVVLGICVIIGGVCAWHVIMDIWDGWKIKHEGVDENSRPLRHEFALRTPTQEMAAIKVFYVPQEWVAACADLPRGRHDGSQLMLAAA